MDREIQGKKAALGKPDLTACLRERWSLKKKDIGYIGKKGRGKNQDKKSGDPVHQGGKDKVRSQKEKRDLPRGGKDRKRKVPLTEKKGPSPGRGGKQDPKVSTSRKKAVLLKKGEKGHQHRRGKATLGESEGSSST